MNTSTPLKQNNHMRKKIKNITCSAFRERQKMLGMWLCMLLMASSTLTNAQNNQKIYHWMQQLGGPGWDVAHQYSYRQQKQCVCGR